MCRWPVLAPDAPLAQRWLNAGWGMRNSSGMGLRIPGEPPVAGLVPDGPAVVERSRPWPPMAVRRCDRAVLRGKADQMECGTWATPQVPPGCARPVRPRAAVVVASVELTWPAPASDRAWKDLLGRRSARVLEAGQRPAPPRSTPARPGRWLGLANRVREHWDVKSRARDSWDQER